MVGTICPIGGGALPQREVWRVGSSFAVGAFLGGLAWGAWAIVMGTFLQLVGATEGLAVAIACVIAVAALVAEADPAVARRTPTRRQVPASWWLRYGADRAAFISGIQLGTGILTRINWWGWYLAAALMCLSPPLIALAAGGLFGLSRGAQPTVVTLYSQRHRTSLGAAIEAHISHLNSARWSRTGTLAIGLTLVAVVATAVWD